jgi:glycerophosphoryl diester phosphodiesterase
VSFFEASGPLVFAHRGGCALAPENTIAAFDRGVAVGADGVELDVHLSRDGTVVVHHDDTLDRTTSDSGPLAARTAAELSRIDAGHAFFDGRGHPFRGQGIGVPTLREVLGRYPDRRIIIEMKVDSREMGQAVAHEVRLAGAGDRVCLAGYGARSAAAAREALPGTACSACYSEVRVAVYRALVWCPVRHARYGGYQIPERSGRLRLVSPRFIRYSHRAGLKVQVWTVDEEADMRRFLGWGADALITNRPDLAVRVRDAWCAGPEPRVPSPESRA